MLTKNQWLGLFKVFYDLAGHEGLFGFNLLDVGLDGLGWFLFLNKDGPQNA